MADSRFISARPQDRQRMAESAHAVMTCLERVADLGGAR